MAKYKRITKREIIDRSGRWQADGCATWSLFNAGNTLISIDAAIVIFPGETYEGPTETPDIQDFSVMDINFSEVDFIPEDYAAIAGVNPSKTNYVPGNPPPPLDKRLVISKSYVTPI